MLTARGESSLATPTMRDYAPPKDGAAALTSVSESHTTNGIGTPSHPPSTPPPTNTNSDNLVEPESTPTAAQCQTDADFDDADRAANIYGNPSTDGTAKDVRPPATAATSLADTGAEEDLAKTSQ